MTTRKILTCKESETASEIAAKLRPLYSAFCPAHISEYSCLLRVTNGRVSRWPARPLFPRQRRRRVGASAKGQTCHFALRKNSESFSVAPPSSRSQNSDSRRAILPH